MISAERKMRAAINLGWIPVPRCAQPDAAVTDPEQAEDVWTLWALARHLPLNKQTELLNRRAQPLLDRYYEMYGPTALDNPENLHLLLYTLDLAETNVIRRGSRRVSYRHSCDKGRKEVDCCRFGDLYAVYEQFIQKRKVWWMYDDDIPACADYAQLLIDHMV